MYNQPIWISDNNGMNIPCYPELNQNLNCDTVIVGGGLAGIITAYFLTQAGQQVVLLEGNRIMHGVSGHSTAKITSQHNIIYSKLIKRFGMLKAKLYADANQKAIDKYEEIIRSENIACDFVRQNANLYTRNPKGISKLQEETEAAKKLGIDAHFSEKGNLPFSVEGVMTFRNQAMFNPYLFGISLASIISRRGGKIFENSRVTEVTPISVRTGKYTVTAKSIVLATNFPIINFPGWYFARLYQERSYLTALKNISGIDGYYLSIDKDEKTFRMYKDYLIVGGKSHKTGKEGNKDHYGEIKAFTENIFPGSSVIAQWSAQDCHTLDGLPYIGKFSKKTNNIYVATGFAKWGMTNSMVAGMIISDLIVKGSNEWEPVFSPLRPMVPAAWAQLAYNVVRFVYNFIAGWISSLFRKKPTCTHMYCKLSYNRDEKTYDCPCHGSRFDKEGSVLQSPARFKLRQ